MAGLCPLITIHVTSKYGWEYAMLLPGLLAITFSPLIYTKIYNSKKEAGIKVENRVEGQKAKPEVPQGSWSKVIGQILRSPFLWVLLVGDFLTAMLKSGIGDWIQLYLIQDKKQSQSTGMFI